MYEITLVRPLRPRQRGMVKLPNQAFPSRTLGQLAITYQVAHPPLAGMVKLPNKTFLAKRQGSWHYLLGSTIPRWRGEGGGPPKPQPCLNHNFTVGLCAF
jgi:hypothetical protein